MRRATSLPSRAEGETGRETGREGRVELAQACFDFLPTAPCSTSRAGPNRISSHTTADECLNLPTKNARRSSAGQCPGARTTGSCASPRSRFQARSASLSPSSPWLPSRIAATSASSSTRTKWRTRRNACGSSRRATRRRQSRAEVRDHRKPGAPTHVGAAGRRHLGNARPVRHCAGAGHGRGATRAI